jgi:hypothetical protein
MPNRPGHPTIDSSKTPIKGLHEHTRPKNSVDEFWGHRRHEAMIRMLKIVGVGYSAAILFNKHAVRSDSPVLQCTDDGKIRASDRRAATRATDRVTGHPTYCRITQTGSKETSRMVLSDVCLTSGSQACTI